MKNLTVYLYWSVQKIRQSEIGLGVGPLPTNAGKGGGACSVYVLGRLVRQTHFMITKFLALTYRYEADKVAIFQHGVRRLC